MNQETTLKKDVFEKKAPRRKEWWERSIDIYFRDQKRDPAKLREDMALFRKKFQQDMKLMTGKKILTIKGTQNDEYMTKFQKDIEEYRKRMFGGKN